MLRICHYCRLPIVSGEEVVFVKGGKEIVSYHGWHKVEEVFFNYDANEWREIECHNAKQPTSRPRSSVDEKQLQDITYAQFMEPGLKSASKPESENAQELLSNMDTTQDTSKKKFSTKLMISRPIQILKSWISRSRT
jgi:nitrate reductase beta subunit